MFISHIIGGLGNQMFQYASGRALSLDREVPHRVDTQDFEGYALHNGYELNRVFNINPQSASHSDLRSVLGWRSPSFIRRRLFRDDMVWLRGPNLIVDTQLASWTELSDVPDDCYLMGNWQTEKYFQNAEETIRSDFSFKTPLIGKNKEIADRMLGRQAVSLHVRRGDMAKNATSLAFHGLCTLEYYQRAVEYVISRIAQPEFFIFSDDIPWAKNNIKLEHPCHFVDFNAGSESYNDMHLMSLCRHHIIANSSFSWWGAWLNPGKDKIVVAPQRWFAVEYDALNIVPPGWIKL